MPAQGNPHALDVQHHRVAADRTLMDQRHPRALDQAELQQAPLQLQRIGGIVLDRFDSVNPATPDPGGPGSA